MVTRPNCFSLLGRACACRAKDRLPMSDDGIETVRMRGVLNASPNSALLVFKMDLGDLDDMLDADEDNEFVVAIASNGARFQLCIFGPL